MKKIILTLALLSSHGAYANTMNVDSITYDDFHKQIVEANKQSTNKQIQDIENEIVINNTSHKFFILDSDRVKPVSTDYYKEIMTYKNEDIDKASFVVNSRLIVKELLKQGYVYHYYLKHCDEGAKDYVFPVSLMTGQGLTTVFTNTMLQTFVKTGNYDYLWNSNLDWHLWGTNNIVIKKNSHLATCDFKQNIIYSDDYYNKWGGKLYNHLKITIINPRTVVFTINGEKKENIIGDKFEMKSDPFNVTLNIINKD